MKDNGWISDSSWDTVVVGSGIGGAMAAHALAARGKKVLVIEKGSGGAIDPARLPVWSQKILDLKSGQSFTPFLGEGIGGSSRLYGMVMERLVKEDFQAAGGIWPESVSEWHPFFDEAEKLFEAKPAIEEKNFDFITRQLILNDIPVHPLILAYQQRSNCEYCQSSICQRSCKIDAWTGVLEKDVELGKVDLLKQTEVLELVHKDGRVHHLRCLKRNSEDVSEEISIRADRFILAAGALRTPGLLRRATNLGSLTSFAELKAIGHYLMRHLIDLYSLHWPGWDGLSRHEQTHLARVKAWGTDSILDQNGRRLGILQSFGRLPVFEKVWSELLEQNPSLKWIPGSKWVTQAMVDRLFRIPLSASIVEDTPIESNFIREKKDGTLEMDYSLSKLDQKKVEDLRMKVKSIFSQNISRVFKEAHNNRRLAHAFRDKSKVNKNHPT